MSIHEPCGASTGASAAAGAAGAGEASALRSMAPRVKIDCVGRSLMLTSLGAPSEPGGLPVDPPLGAQRIADLAQRGLDPAGLDHRLDHVAATVRHGDHVLDRRLHLGVIALLAPLLEHPDL